MSLLPSKRGCLKETRKEIVFEFLTVFVKIGNNFWAIKQSFSSASCFHEKKSPVCKHVTFCLIILYRELKFWPRF